MNLKDLETLKKCPLFAGVNDAGALTLELSGRILEYEKGALVKKAGDATKLMVLLEGGLMVYTLDYFGTRSIINKLSPPEFFGGAHAFGSRKDFLLFFETQTGCRVLEIDPEKTKTASSPDAVRFLSNNLSAISSRCLSFLEKIDILSKKTIRGRVLTYLAQASGRTENTYFDIPFSRQELADFLACDRTALSAELGRMKKYGLIDYKMNTFKIIKGIRP